MGGITFLFESPRYFIDKHSRYRLAQAAAKHGGTALKITPPPKPSSVTAGIITSRDYLTKNLVFSFYFACRQPQTTETKSREERRRVKNNSARDATPFLASTLVRAMHPVRSHQRGSKWFVATYRTGQYLLRGHDKAYKQHIETLSTISISKMPPITNSNTLRLQMAMAAILWYLPLPPPMPVYT